MSEKPMRPTETVPGDDYLLDGSQVRFSRKDGDSAFMTTGGREYEVGAIVMAFPISKRARFVAVRDNQGEELGIIRDVGSLDPHSWRIVSEEVERSYFMPLILEVLDVTEKLAVGTWKVETDRGSRTFQVRRPRQNLRKIGRRIIIRDVDGNRYEIRDWRKLSLRARSQIEEYI